jgi:hypothetical protein
MPAQLKRKNIPVTNCIHCKAPFSVNHVKRHVEACSFNPVNGKNSIKFLKAVKLHMKSTRATAMEAVLDIGERFGVDMEEAASMLDKPFKDLIAEEATALKLLKKVDG